MALLTAILWTPSIASTFHWLGISSGSNEILSLLSCPTTAVDVMTLWPSLHSHPSIHSSALLSRMLPLWSGCCHHNNQINTKLPPPPNISSSIFSFYINVQLTALAPIKIQSPLSTFIKTSTENMMALCSLEETILRTTQSIGRVIGQGNTHPISTINVCAFPFIYTWFFPWKMYIFSRPAAFIYLIC